MKVLLPGPVARPTYVLVAGDELVEERHEVRAAEVGDGAQPSQQTAVRDLLEVPLADVLKHNTSRIRKV